MCEGRGIKLYRRLCRETMTVKICKSLAQVPNSASDLTDFSVVKGLTQGLRFVNTQLTKFQVGIYTYNLGQNKKEQLTRFPRL